MRMFPPLLALACLLAAGCAASRGELKIDSPYRDLATLEKGEIVHLATGRLLSGAELLDYLGAFPVVYVGESHDSVDDHAVQLEILTGLADRHPGEVVLGMEMLRRPFQQEVDSYLAGEMSDKDFLRVWQKNWGPGSFPYYRAILAFSKERGIPILALNAGKDLRMAVGRQGLQGLDPEMAQRLPEMDLDDPYHRAFIQGIFGGHTQGANHSAAFHEIQSLWDETMAETAADYLRSPAGQGKRLVIFAGGNHVRYGFGIPRRLFRRIALPYVIVDPLAVEFPEEKLDKLMDVDLPELPMRAADVYWAVGYEDLEGERVMLGVQIEEREEGGVLVTGVVPDSPAAAAGVEKGDVVVAVDDVPVQEIFDLTYQVGTHGPGDTGSVEVERAGERLTLRVVYDVVKHGQ